MPVFQYRAFDGQGAVVRGTLAAASARAAREELIGRGLSPSAVRSAAPSQGLHRRVSSGDLGLALRQLAAMVRAGMPLVQALRALADQVEGASMTAVASALADDVAQGTSLGDACARHPSSFPAEVVGMIRAGEKAGTLGTVLERAAGGLEANARLTERFRTAMLYPLLLAVLGGALVVFLFLFVVPRIAGLFVELNRALPLVTQIMLGVASAMRWIVPVGVGLAALAVVGWRVAGSRPEVRLRADRARLRLPIVGRLARANEGARYARTLASLLGGGVRAVDALEIAQQAAGNRAVAADLASVCPAVRRGVPLSRALEETGALPPLIHHLARAGEASGDLAPLLHHGADILEETIRERTARISTLVESGLILVIGLAFLCVALGLLLPIFELNRIPM